MRHPCREPALTLSRRQFLPVLLQEVFVLADSFKGRQTCCLSDLGSLPNDRLARVKPVVNPEHQIFVDQGYVCCRSRRTKATLKLFATDRENLVVFNMFNGQHDLGEIGECLSREMGWDGDRGFDHARDLFLSLVGRLVCIPKDPIEAEE